MFRLLRRLFGIRFLVVALVCTVLVVLVLVFLSKLYRWVRRRADRQAGIPCARCHRRAFPIEGTVVRYRCWQCGYRFKGPQHCN
jgi:hypothetical protein